MIFLNGSINRLSQQQIEQEAAAYEANGWELRDSTSHNVRITIAVEDIPAFCEYLQQLPLDQKPKVWTDRRTGERLEAPAVSFYLKGVEMAGNWISLKAGLKNRDNRAQPSAAPTATPAGTPARRSAQAPLRRSTAAAAAPSGASQLPLAAPPAAPGWHSAPLSNDLEDDDVPF
jgi:hypothetical protein